ncbi:MAG TPA: PadR family transcriptional regulator [Acidimicrobiia bacterium]|nr:PadR family transcriptional regulator [Acidimicrobiia bacterium]
MVLELAVLGLLKDQPLHGYELKKRLGETLGFLWGVSFGSLYPALRRLERTGAIAIVTPTESPVPSPSTGSLSGDLAAARLKAMAGRLSATGRRTRKAYQITETGETLFAELLLADEPHSDDEKAFALKLAFCRHLQSAQRIELLDRRRRVLAERLDRQRQVHGIRDDRYTRSLMEHRTKSTQRDLEWVDELITAERAGPGGSPTDAASDAVKEEASA